MVPWKVLLSFLLVAHSLASFITAMSAQGRPVVDPRNDVALNYVSTRTLRYVLIVSRAHDQRARTPEKKPFLFSFAKAKVIGAWLKIGAMPLTRGCLKHKKARSVAGGRGPDADKFEALGVEHKTNVKRLKDMGYRSTFAGSVPTYLHVARPSAEEDQVAALVALGTINTKNLKVVVPTR